MPNHSIRPQSTTPQSSPPRWSPTLATRLVRRPVLYWSLAIVLAAATAITVDRTISVGEELRSAYGATVEVVVTTAPVTRGDVLQGSTERRAIPIGLAPADALNDLADDAIASRSISEGAVLTSQDINAADDLRPDQAAIAIPLSPSTPALTPGQHVLVVVNADPFVGVEPAQIPGVVHSIDEERATLAVARSDLVVLSAALQAGSITIALT